MQLRMPTPGQRLLLPGTGGEGSGRWSWLEAAAGGGHASRGDGSGASGSSASSTDGGSSEEDEDGSGGQRAQRAFRHGSAQQQELRLQQQMEAQVYASGGLLAEVARRLDAMAGEALGAGGGSGGDGGGATGGSPAALARFEGVLLAIGAQAQQLLSGPGGVSEAALLDDKGRADMTEQLALQAHPHQEEQLQVCAANAGGHTGRWCRRF